MSYCVNSMKSQSLSAIIMQVERSGSSPVDVGGADTNIGWRFLLDSCLGSLYSSRGRAKHVLQLQFWKQQTKLVVCKSGSNGIQRGIIPFTFLSILALDCQLLIDDGLQLSLVLGRKVLTAHFPSRVTVSPTCIGLLHNGVDQHIASLYSEVSATNAF